MHLIICFLLNRIKGEKIIKREDHIFPSCPREECINSNGSSLSLQVEGKKMAIHAPEKYFRKTNFEIAPDSSEPDIFEEIILSHYDDEDNSTFLKKNENTENLQAKEQVTETETPISVEYLQEKIVEKLAQHIWPKVLKTLQNCHEDKKWDKKVEDIQLPPIFAVQVDQKRSATNQRPKTEGSNLSVLDFPKLSSFLSVSPKVLQDRKECKSGRSSLRSSRPNSEIHSRRNNAHSSYASNLFSQSTCKVSSTSNCLKQVQFLSKKAQKKEDMDKMSYLPALEEDINDPVDYLRGLSLHTDTKTVSSSVVSHFPKKSECFLPPIDADNINPDLKLSIKQSDNLSYRFLTDNYSSIKNSHPAEVRKVGDNCDKQLTLFPIVTSLVPSKEKTCSSARKNFLSSLNERKR
ncbi:uncharacterized protein [Parasteatoda tepidariorum]|uniref:uncharacterized protein isoform X2 n=1 Tax=Parasteatoda tepidariorum TaxID=114398 RepID=UPI0039BCE2E8